MKYIRTKDGRIIELPKQPTLMKYENTILDLNEIRKGKVGHEIISALIDKQADTIEKLCDEFVYTGSKFSPYFRTKGYGSWDGTRIESDKDIHKELQSKGCVFYGAIWTSMGLIYVAKMNEKGELELL